MPEFTYNYDDQYDCLGLFVDGKLVTEWSCPGTPEQGLEEFKKIYLAGMNHTKEKTSE